MSLLQLKVSYVKSKWRTLPEAFLRRHKCIYGLSKFTIIDALLIDFLEQTLTILSNKN